MRLKRAQLNYNAKNCQTRGTLLVSIFYKEFKMEFNNDIINEELGLPEDFEENVYGFCVECGSLDIETKIFNVWDVSVKCKTCNHDEIYEQL